MGHNMDERDWTDAGPAAWMPDSPFRSPGWRWARARWLHANGRGLDPGIDDGWVARAQQFLAARDKEPLQPARTKSSRSDLAVQGALDLSNETPPERRWL